MKGFVKPEVNTLNPGTLVAERYTVLEVIGQGGMGVVYKAQDSRTDRLVALKMILRTNFAEDHRRFEREAHAASLLNHPNVISILDFGWNDRDAYLCMEYLEGRTLEDVIEQKPLNTTQFRHIFAQACNGLQLAHEKGIVHRDLKPSNLMIVDRGGDSESVIVLDFGLVKMLDSDSDPAQKLTKLTRTNMLLGSPLYMSPEQCRSLEVDHRSDIYSLGCVMYESLTGTPPIVADTLFDVMNKHISETPRSLREARPGLYVPAALERLILSTMAKAPEDRPQSMAEIAKKIESAFSGAPDVLLAASVSSKVTKDVAALSTSKSGSTGSAGKKQQSGLVLSTIVLGLALMGMTAMFLTYSQHQQRTNNICPQKTDVSDRPSEQQTSSVNTASVDQVVKVPPAMTARNSIVDRNQPASPGASAAQKLTPLNTVASSQSAPKSDPVVIQPAAIPGTTGGIAAGNPAETKPGISPSAPPTNSGAGAPSLIAASSQPERTSALATDGNTFFRRGEWAQARSQFEASRNSLPSDRQLPVLAKLIVCCDHMRDSAAAASYIKEFKERFSFYSSGSIDSEQLMHVYEVSREVSEVDYTFADKLLRTAIDEYSRLNTRPSRPLFKMKLELNHIYADQGKISDSEQLLTELLHETEDFPDVNTEVKMHLARIQARSSQSAGLFEPPPGPPPGMRPEPGAGFLGGPPGGPDGGGRGPDGGGRGPGPQNGRGW